MYFTSTEQDTEMDQVIDRLKKWGACREDVRAILLTSSRASPNAKVDAFSDYDVILVVTNISDYYEDKTWLSDFGPTLVVYHDPLRKKYGSDCFSEITQYATGLKIDFNVYPKEVLTRIAAAPALPDELDVGYAVLLDKDGLTAGLRPATYRAHIPQPPTQSSYLTLVENFFHEATYVAKHLWRGDMLAAKYNLDYAMKYLNLQRMMVWRFEIDHDWSVKPGSYGRGLQSKLSAERWRQFESTYVGLGIDENWDAFFRTVELFRDVAAEVGEHLGYPYPQDLDRRCLDYLRRVRSLDSDATAFVGQGPPQPV